jgi:hypothetical protein
MGAFGNDRLELIGQTAENRVQKMVETWAESGPIAPVTFGIALVRFVILIGYRTMTNLFSTRVT